MINLEGNACPLAYDELETRVNEESVDSWQSKFPPSSTITITTNIVSPHEVARWKKERCGTDTSQNTQLSNSDRLNFIVYKLVILCRTGLINFLVRNDFVRSRVSRSGIRCPPPLSVKSAEFLFLTEKSLART